MCLYAIKLLLLDPKIPQNGTSHKALDTSWPLKKHNCRRCGGVVHMRQEVLEAKELCLVRTGGVVYWGGGGPGDG